MNTVLQVLGLLAAVIVFLRIEPALNLMGSGCRLPVRVAFWMLAVGAASFVLAITQGYVPGLSVVVMLWGLAILLVAERRLRDIYRLEGRPRRLERRAAP